MGEEHLQRLVLQAGHRSPPGSLAICSEIKPVIKLSNRGVDGGRECNKPVIALSACAVCFDGRAGFREALRESDYFSVSDAENVRGIR